MYHLTPALTTVPSRTPHRPGTGHGQGPPTAHSYTMIHVHAGIHTTDREA